jgi:21S rRNA (GM2251-2'-O)-methyltransferase
MNSLEGAGFVHLYGLSSVLNALTANRRDFKTSVEKSITTDHDVDARFRRDFDPDFSDDDDYDDIDHAQAKTQDTTVAVKPQAQFRPYLFVQEGREKSGRRGSKASTAQRVLQLAEERNIPIAYVDKGILNTLSSNRPHQGFVLRCGKLYFEGMSRIPMPSGENESPSLWLVLDEVVDPQNLGALLRSAYFLGGGNTPSVHSRVGILVCSKNSAPPSPVVSAASAGALELLEVYSTTNLPRTLNQAREDGFRIIGASSSVPSNVAGGSQNNKRQNEEGGVEDWAPPLYDLQDLPAQGAEGDDRPILMVLGSEGHGLRTLVAKACTEFVRIPSGLGTSSVSDEGLDSDHENDDDDYDDDSNGEPGVDSLNVSVTGGIMLWHLLYGGAR